ncbi:hypothetical protein P154DRAFT_425585 [Amniculicola lignicola CBS 123094]|uniref:Zn(2)-C6 fungal-type domain-containing protein n=1 Tax=Amniculicola lignicola CBS 123094 TaxID=1392246 RepID=A0A6A5WVZ9_9PLEO|nr:hypothetical protein P154DRAFT_425585 [Amniculicola lignicola CBS 123094]
MVRPSTSTDAAGDAGDAADAADAPARAHSEAKAKASKRRCIQSACVPCRRRKSKCDGGTPHCATCLAVYKTPCFYDVESESRRGKMTTAVKRDGAGVVAGESSDRDHNHNHAEFLVNAIRTLPESEVFELVQQLRNPRLDVWSLAEALRRTVPLLATHGPHEQESLETDLSVLMGKPALTQMGESRHYGHTSSLGLVAEDENYTQARVQLSNKPSTWTAVTQDLLFVERLFNLYFSWSHPFYVIFSRECFLNDFRSGRTKYCSPLLVNAILSYACHFTDDPAGRADPRNFRTAGDHFFAEARRLLYEDDAPSLTTTQALAVMAMREPSAGRDSSGFMYMGRCMRMAVELGLHLNNSAAPKHHLTPSEIEVRKVTFWGCFVVDTVWSVCIGRISQLPRAAITVDKPILTESPQQQGAATTRMFLQEFSTLSELVNDNNFMFFAPKERFTSRRLLDMYHNYVNWHKHLPSSLLIQQGAEAPPPHCLICRSMLYHTIVLHLFRPLLKVDILQSEIRPRDLCIESANKVSELLRLYRHSYTLRACQLVLTHILLSICIVHLIYSRDYKQSQENLVEGLRALEDMSVCHYYGARSFKIVHALAKTWKLPWPEKLEVSKLIIQEDGSVISPSEKTLLDHPVAAALTDDPADYTTAGPSTQPNRRESLSMFAVDSGSMGIQISPISVSQGTAMMPNHYNPSSGFVYPQAPTSVSIPVPPPPAPADQLFWTPMPGVGVPILPRDYAPNSMDLNNMLGATDEWDRFGRDGFRMSGAWLQEPVQHFVQAGGVGAAYGGLEELGQQAQGAYEGWWNGGPAGAEGGGG